MSVFLLFLFIVSSIWGKMVLKPYSGCRGFALIRLFFGGGFARSALLYGICVLWLFSENLKIQNVVCDTTSDIQNGLYMRWICYLKTT